MSWFSRLERKLGFGFILDAFKPPSIPTPEVTAPVAAPAVADPIAVASQQAGVEAAKSTSTFPFTTRKKSILASASSLGSSGTLY